VLEPSGLYLPNRIARAFFLAMDDVMGQHGLSQLLEYAQLTHYTDAYPPDTLDKQFDCADLSSLSMGLEQMYGARGGRGMALRIGRASFAQGLKRFGAMRGVADPAFRALPLEKRIDYGLRGLAAIYTRFSDQKTSVQADDDGYQVIIENSPMTWGRSADKPVCHAQTGIIQECLRWASNGYEFYVRETTCRAQGPDACIFKVNKVAIGENSRR
jgi:hypothetical protein